MAEVTEHPEVRDPVDTPEFAAWFGDSKIVDQKGRPLPVYHGGLRFDDFNKEPAAKATYTTLDVYDAYTYAAQYNPGEAEVKRLYLRINNPLDLRDPAVFEKWVGVSLEPSPFSGDLRYSMMREAFDLRSGGKLIDRIRAAGYDGFIFYDTNVYNRGPIESYAFFEPAQAKSAGPDPYDGRLYYDYPIRQDSNNGEFSADEPSILMHQSAPVGERYYHGANGPIDRFKGWAWFSRTPELAEQYAALRGGEDARVYSASLRFSRPFDADMLPEATSVTDFLEEVVSQAADVDVHEIAGITTRLRSLARREESGPHYSRHDFWYQASSFFGAEGADLIKKALRLAGFDAIRMTELGEQTIGVLDGEQVLDYEEYDPILLKRTSTPTMPRVKAERLTSWLEGSAVCENGQPLIVYHGTKSAFTKFDLGLAGVSAPGVAGPGIYLTVDPQEASRIALDEGYGDGDAPNVVPCIVSLKNPAIIEDRQIQGIGALGDLYPRGINLVDAESVHRKLVEAGHDGAIILSEGQIAEVVAFSDKSVRSALQYLAGMSTLEKVELARNKRALAREEEIEARRQRKIAKASRRLDQRADDLEHLAKSSFERWSGGYAVLAEDIRPQVFYIEANSHSQLVAESAWYEFGVHLTREPDPERLDRFEPCYLRTINPLKLVPPPASWRYRDLLETITTQHPTLISREDLEYCEHASNPMSALRAVLLDLGHDAIETQAFAGGTSDFTALRPENIKHARDVGAASSLRADIMLHLSGAPDATPTLSEAAAEGTPAPLYSALSAAAERLQTRSAPAAQWRSTLAALPGVKLDEINWSGVDRWLSDIQSAATAQSQGEYLTAGQQSLLERAPGGQVAKADLIAFLREGAVTVHEVVRSDAVGVPLRHAAIGNDNGQRPHELVLTLPLSASALELERLHSDLSTAKELRRQAAAYANAESSRGMREIAANAESRIAALEGRIESLNAQAAGRRTFETAHFPERNIVAHLRFTEDRDDAGRRILVLQEIQSDWAQAGRGRGFATDEQLLEAARQSTNLHSDLYQRLDTLADYCPDIAEAGSYTAAAEMLKRGTANLAGASREVVDAAMAAMGAAEAASARYDRLRATVPDMPFRKRWPMLAMRRAIVWAVQNGFDSVAWTPGALQNDRFAMDRPLQSLRWSIGADAQVTVSCRDDAGVLTSVFTCPQARLADHISPGAAEGIIAEIDAGADEGMRSEKGLSVRKAGMESFYDRQLVNETSRLISQWGGRVGKRTLSAGRDAGQASFHCFDVTPQMRESARSGLPMMRVTHLPFAVEQRRRLVACDNDLQRAMRRLAQRGVSARLEPTSERIEPLDAIAKAFRKRIVYFRQSAQDMVDGFVMPDEPATIYINAASREPLKAVLGHEITHHLRRQDPAAYDALFEVAKAHYTGPGELGEEALCDYVGNRFLDPAFLNAVEARVGGLSARILNVARNALSRAISAVKAWMGDSPEPAQALQGSDLIRDCAQMRVAAREAVVSYRKLMSTIDLDANPGKQYGHVIDEPLMEQQHG